MNRPRKRAIKRKNQSVVLIDRVLSAQITGKPDVVQYQIHNPIVIVRPAAQPGSHAGTEWYRNLPTKWNPSIAGMIEAN
jgi:hypothetical protein